MIVRYPKPKTLLGIRRDRHCVIEASAGTGKTYTLEHLVVDILLTTSAKLENILVVTFTDKATGELKRRIRALIERVIRQAEPVDSRLLANGLSKLETEQPQWWYLDEDRRQKLEQQLFSFETAPIQTIHGFCRRVLTEVAFDARQHLEQTRVDSDEIFEWAWQDRLSHLFLVDETYRADIKRWLSTGEDLDSLKTLLASAHRVGFLAQSNVLDDLTMSILKTMGQACQHTDYLQELHALAIQPAALNRAESIYPVLLNVLQSPQPLTDLDQLDAMSFRSLLRPALRPSRNPSERFPDGLTDAGRTMWNELRDLERIQILKKGEMQGYVERFLPAIAEAVQNRKTIDGLFEFDDLLVRVCDVLKSNQGPRVIQQLQTRYSHALIDEFQDTDRRQWQIFKMLFIDQGSGQLFVIGDPKQAIYSFRGADVQTYLEARQILLERSDDPACHIQLETNYRTTSALIDAVNRLLVGHPKAPFFSGDIGYTKPVQCGRPSRRIVDQGSITPSDAKPITLLHYEPPARRQRRALSGWRLMTVFANAIVDELDAILGTKPSRYCLVDEDGQRSMKASDIYILVRTRREGAFMADLLRRHGHSCVLQQTTSIFETNAAQDVWALLKAIERPNDHARRMAAFSGPFFPIAWTELKHYEALDDSHPYTRQLKGWKALCECGQFGRAFRAMQFESGLVTRLCLDVHGEQHRIDIAHIFECMVEWCGHERMELSAIIRRLEDEMHGRRAGESSGIQTRRLPLTEDAIQIMTLHKSKGLEAQCVFVYGGFLSTWYPPVRALKHRDHRLVLMGEDAEQAFAMPLRQEARYEDERLYYVGLTRAGAKLYLPYVSTPGAIAGPYSVVNDQVHLCLNEKTFDAADYDARPIDAERRFPQNELFDDATRRWQMSDEVITHWKASETDAIRQLKWTSAPLVVTSYSSLKSKTERRQSDDAERAEPENIDTAVSSLNDPSSRLPGGKHIGRCLHEIIELIDLDTVARTRFNEWVEASDTVALCRQAFRRHRIEERHLFDAQTLIYRTLTTPFEVGPTLTLPPLCTVHGKREVEFIFPIPETHHGLLDCIDHDNSRWTAERGFIKGYIDYVFEHEGKYYWIDWKSDLLSSYDTATIDEHVQTHYRLQANLYSLSCTRLIGAQDQETFNTRFGGFIYVFLRGITDLGDPSTGIYFRRPSWREIQSFERQLISDERLPQRRTV